MIIKLITSCIIIGCSTLIGVELSQRHVKRIRELREFQGLLSRLEAEILHYSTKLPEAMGLIGSSMKGEVGRVFLLTAEKLSGSKSYNAAQAWNKALDELRHGLYLVDEEFEILYRFGEQLGVSDKDGQKKYIQLTLSQLYNQEVKAQELRTKYERMYKSLGLLGGLALAIILF